MFDSVDYHPHSLQQQIHAASAGHRFRVVSAGRRTGKSTMGGHELTPLALKALSVQHTLDPTGKRMEYWIVGPNYVDSEKEFRTVYNDLKRLEMPFDKPGTYYDVNAGNMHISLWGGRFLIHAKSAAHPESLVGEGLHGIIMAEAAKLKPTIWTKYLRPTLADYRGWALMTSCVAGDTLVQTEHGLRHIDELSSNRTPGTYSPLGQKVAGFAPSHEEASQFYVNGPAQTRDLTFTNGYRITATPNHRLWTPEGWTYVGDLAPGDWVALRAGAELWGSERGEDYVAPPQTHHSVKPSPFPLRLTPDTAYFLGLLLGDGYWNSEGVFNLSVGVHPELWRWCEEFGLPLEEQRVHPRTGTEARSYGCTRKVVADWFAWLGLDPSWTSRTREIPHRLRSMPRELTMALLAGLWDSDGTMNPNGSAWYSTTSSRLAEQIQAILVNMGLHPSIERYEDGGNRVTLTAHESLSLMDQIPVLVPSKRSRGYTPRRETSPRVPNQVERIQRLRSRYDMRGRARHLSSSSPSWLGQVKNPGVHRVLSWLGAVQEVFPASVDDPDVVALRDACQYSWVQVKTVTSSEAFTYDLCVPTTHAYTANGLVSHNTPEGRNWFYDMWMQGQRGQLGWWSVRAPSWSNDIVYPGGRNDPEIVAMEAEMSAEKFNQEIAADFTEYVGRVFKDFDEELHVAHLPLDPSLPVYVAMDFGYTNPTVALFIQVDVWENVKVIGEYYRSHRTAAEVARDIWEHPRLGPLARRARILYPDPEDPSTANELGREWGVQPVRGTGGLLRDRIELIRRWLQVPEGLLHSDMPDSAQVPRLQVDFSCTHLIYEMGAYRYPETQQEQQHAHENPLKKDDHAPEALGRFFAGHFHKSSPRGRAKQRRAHTRR